MQSIKTLSVAFTLLLTGCVGNMNPTGNMTRPNYPYYTTQQPIAVKNIRVPAGTTLVYEKYAFKKGKQERLLPEDKLTDIKLPEGKTIVWGGVPVTQISRFFNTEMRGYSVYADFNQLELKQWTKFSQLWQSCNDDLGITVKDTRDWSFNKNNIADVESCSVNYQRYFKDDAQQKQFLDTLYSELMKVDSPS
ncbi:hypothetical protein ACF8D3_03800 [Acinetobacter sp. YQ_14]|uniref:hypothetical protein n=1 Tax=Acinetobacter sp. YQ_14 TaxID=3367236 RepID=UPI00370C6AE3